MAQFLTVLSIAGGAGVGALLRWWFSLRLNSIFPTIPLGTLTANIVGAFLIGIYMGITKNHAFIPEYGRLAISTGFLGGLTTFSTFSAETVTLISNHDYLWSGVIITVHLLGSLLATISGIFVVKLVTH